MASPYPTLEGSLKDNFPLLLRGCPLSFGLLRGLFALHFLYRLIVSMCGSTREPSSRLEGFVPIYTTSIRVSYGGTSLNRAFTSFFMDLMDITISCDKTRNRPNVTLLPDDSKHRCLGHRQASHRPVMWSTRHFPSVGFTVNESCSIVHVDCSSFLSNRLLTTTFNNPTS